MTNPFGKRMLLLDQVFELLHLRRMPEPRERPGLDLADAFTRDVEGLAHFLERLGCAVLEAVTHLDDLALAIAELIEQLTDVRVQQR